MKPISARLRRRVMRLIAREVGSSAFGEVPGHIEDESDSVQVAWPIICKEMAAAIRIAAKEPRK